MSHLVDTNVLCEPQKKRPDSKVVHWLRIHESDVYTSVLVMGEIRFGIELLPAHSSKRAALLAWHERLRHVMAGRILSINARVADEWANLQAQARLASRTLRVVDSLLAATARRYRLTIVTDNTKHFRAIGIHVFNPFD